MLDRFSRYAFFTFLVLLPIQTVWLWREPMIDGVKWQYGTIGLYGTDVLLTLVLISFFVSKSRHSMAQLDFAGLSLGAIVVLVGASVLWADDRVLAGYFFFKLLLAWGVFCLVRAWGVSEIRKVFGLVLIVTVMESVLGIGQFLSQSSFASTLLGMSEYESWRAGVSVLKNESGRWLRAYGTFPHPNMFGAYLGAMLLVGIGHFMFFGKVSKSIVFPLEKYFFPARASTRSALKKIFSIENILVYTWIVVVLLALILSFSRSAWLGTLIGLCALVYAVYIQKDAHTKRRFVRIASIIAIAAAVFVGILHEVVFPRFDGTTIQKEASLIDRAVLMRQAEEIIREHPLLGVGAGNYTLAVIRNHPEIPVWDVQPVHNVFLLVFAELGVIGVLLFLSFLLAVFWQGFLSFRTCFGIFVRRDGCSVEMLKQVQHDSIFFIAFLSLLPSLFLDHFLWDSHFGLIFLSVLFGFAMRKPSST